MRGQRFRRLFRLDRFGKRMDDGLEDEVRFHLETREAQLRRAGLSPEEARAEARRGFGDPDRVREECRDIDRWGVYRRAMAESLGDLLQDVRLSARGLARSRGYTFVVLLSLAVGIGINTAALTAIDAFWFAPVPGVTGQDRVVELVVVDRGSEEWAWTYPDFEDVRAASIPLEGLAGWAERDLTLGTHDAGRRVRTAYVTPEFFPVLGVVPTLGRGFRPDEGTGPGQHAVVVLGHDLWQEEFEGDPGVIGRSVLLNREPYTIVGVAPEGFRGPRPTLGSTHLWVPFVQHPYLAEESADLRGRAAFWIGAVGRLRAGVTRGEVESAVRTVFGRLAAAYPETNAERTVKVASFKRFPAQNRMLDALAVGSVVALLVLVLLIICANLAGMALARSAAREQEIAVRLALGSGRLRLARHLMLEAVLLAVVGGGVGMAVAIVAMGTVSPTSLGIVAPDIRFEISGVIVTASLTLTLLASLTLGLPQALRFSRPELVTTIKDDTGGGGRRVGRMQRFAASAQTGVALVGLVLGALFFRSLGSMYRTDQGFEPQGMVVTDFRTGVLSSALMDLAAEGYPTLEGGGGAFLERLSAALSLVPGVTAVAFGDGVPLDRSLARTMVFRADRPDDPGGGLTVEHTRVGEGYLDAVGATLIRGRDVAATDDPTSEPVVLVTTSLAERLWPGEDPLGRPLLRSLGREERQEATVVGVVADMPSSRAGERRPQVFVPMRQEYRARLMIVLRTESDGAVLTDALRSALRSVDPALPMPRLVSGRSMVEQSTQEQRAAATMGGGLGLLVLLLSAMGVYGVVAMTVASRTREIGVRMAMGASRGGVLCIVLRDALRLTAPGLAAGALVAGASASAMRSMLLGVSPVDPPSFLAAGGVLLAVVLMASFVPARRASGIDPMEALRAE